MGRRLTDYERELREKERYEKELAKERKERARKKGYKISTLEDTNRINGYLKDYVFYQFFALKYELNDLTEEQLKEITPKKRKFQAEWKANELPTIQIKKFNNDEPAKSKSYLFELIVFLIVIFVAYGIANSNKSFENEVPKENNNYIQENVVIPVEEPIYEPQEEQINAESLFTIEQSVLHSKYNYYKSPEEIKAEEKARKKQEKQAEKALKKWERAEKKAAKKELKESLKAEKQAAKEQKKQEKKNKKKDKNK